jgi:hypothetical protein
MIQSTGELAPARNERQQLMEFGGPSVPHHET